MYRKHTQSIDELLSRKAIWKKRKYIYHIIHSFYTTFIY